MSEKTAKIVQTVAVLITILAIAVIVYLVVFRSSSGGTFLSAGFSLNDEAEPYRESGQYDVKEPIDDLLIEWANGKVEVSVDDGDAIRFEERSTYSLVENTALRYSVDSGKLHIVDSKRPALFGGFGSNKSLHMVIPESLLDDFSRISITSVSGGMEIDGIKAKNEIALETVSGTLNASGIESERIHINSVSGKVNLDQANAEDVRVDSISGSIFINVENARRIDVDSVSGSITIEPVAAERARINHDRVSGSMNLLGITEDRDAELEINVDTVSGSLTIGQK